MKTILNEKRGRKSLSKTRDEDAAFVRSFPKYANVNSGNMTNTIKTLRAKYLNALQKNNVEIEDAAEKSLSELDQLVKDNNITLSKRNITWKVHEKDVVAGINSLFETGFFKLQQANGQQKTTDKKMFFARQVGGSLKSDVEVVHKRKGTSDISFFIECKLNLDAAEYFKFGLQVDAAGNLKYDHHRFLEGAVKEDKTQLKVIDELFNKKIDLNGFLKEIVSHTDVKKHWKQLLNNLTAVKADLDKSDEYKQFSKTHRLIGVLPDDFQTLALIFDTYCKWYIQRYNQFIDEIFNLVIDDEVKQRKIDFKMYLIGRSDDKRSEVVNTLDELVNLLLNNKNQLIKKEDYNKVNSLVKKAKQIEIKLNVLLRHLGLKENSFHKLGQLKDINKVMYFYKLFVSTVGRKRAGKQELVDMQSDEFGNMQLVPEIELDDSKLPLMITNFYVEKDNCAYIQIDKTLLQFDEDFNPFKIPDLPIFKDAAHKFCVRILVDDELTKISLHIRALELDKKQLAKKNIVSLKQSDSNYLMKVLKNGVKVNV